MQNNTIFVIIGVHAATTNIGGWAGAIGWWQHGRDKVGAQWHWGWGWVVVGSEVAAGFEAVMEFEVAVVKVAVRVVVVVGSGGGGLRCEVAGSRCEVVAARELVRWCWWWQG